VRYIDIRGQILQAAPRTNLICANALLRQPYHACPVAKLYGGRVYQAVVCVFASGVLLAIV